MRKITENRQKITIVTFFIFTVTLLIYDFFNPVH
jgi:hypothetical protein